MRAALIALAAVLAASCGPATRARAPDDVTVPMARAGDGAQARGAVLTDVRGDPCPLAERGRWIRRRAPGPAPTTAEGMGIWTGKTLLFVPHDGARGTGGIYDPCTNAWSLLVTPEPMPALAPVDVGRELLFFGTRHGGVFFGKTQVHDKRDVASLYDPSRGCWRSLNRFGAPFDLLPESFASAWTGEHFIVWGGTRRRARPAGGEIVEDVGGGAMYELATDSWKPISDGGLGARRAPGVWTGSRFVVWGGTRGTPNAPHFGGPAGSAYVRSETVLGNGAMLDPKTGSWRPMSTTNAPSSRSGHMMVWTGLEVLVFGGRIHGADARDGGLYDPERNTWSAIPPPPADVTGSGVWQGRRLLVFSTTASLALDPEKRVWEPIARAPSPGPSGDHYIDRGDVIFVGRDAIMIYHDAENSWSVVPVPSEGRPARGTWIWTGDRILVWDPPDVAMFTPPVVRRT